MNVLHIRDLGIKTHGKKIIKYILNFCQKVSQYQVYQLITGSTADQDDRAEYSKAIYITDRM